MALSQNYVWSQQVCPWSVSVDNGILGKIMIPRFPAAVSLDANQPDLTQRGGCRVISGEFATTDGTARSVLIYRGRRTQVGAISNIGSSSVITRSSGSFLTTTDNNGVAWQVGDLAMIFASATSANNGQIGLVTAVSATNLTVNSTPLTNDAAPGSSTELYRVAQRTRIGIPLSSGNTDSAPAVALLGTSQDVDVASQPDRGLSFGPDDVLIGAMVANLASKPVQLSCDPTVLLY